MAKEKTRREFFKHAGLAVGGVALSSAALFIPQKAAAKEIKPAKGVIMVDKAACLGCRTCEGVCAIAKYKVINPNYSRIKVVKDWRKLNTMDVDFQPSVCLQCADPLCLKSCPVGAIKMDEKSGTDARIVDQSLCIPGCHICERACPYQTSRVMFNDQKKAITCDLCGGDPLCVKYCPSGALTYLYDAKGISWTGYPTLSAEAPAMEKRNEILLAKGGK